MRHKCTRSNLLFAVACYHSRKRAGKHGVHALSHSIVFFYLHASKFRMCLCVSCVWPCGCFCMFRYVCICIWACPCMHSYMYIHLRICLYYIILIQRVTSSRWIIRRDGCFVGDRRWRRRYGCFQTQAVTGLLDGDGWIYVFEYVRNCGRGCL